MFMGFPGPEPSAEGFLPSLFCVGSGVNPRGFFLGLRELSRATKQVWLPIKVASPAPLIWAPSPFHFY